MDQLSLFIVPVCSKSKEGPHSHFKWWSESLLHLPFDTVCLNCCLQISFESSLFFVQQCDNANPKYSLIHGLNNICKPSGSILVSRRFSYLQSTGFFQCWCLYPKEEREKIGVTWYCQDSHLLLILSCCSPGSNLGACWERACWCSSAVSVCVCCRWGCLSVSTSYAIFKPYSWCFAVCYLAISNKCFLQLQSFGLFGCAWMRALLFPTRRAQA